MSLELDHLFVFTASGAPEAADLIDAGLREGTSNVHAGQGTMNRRFFFHNAMLELLWVHDQQEAQSDPVRPAQLWERWRFRQTGYSPFGICVRFAAGATDDVLPFTTWAYRPPFLPPDLQIDVAAQTTPVEPFIFAIPFSGRPDHYPAERREPLEHPTGWREITALRVTLPQPTTVSPALRVLQQQSNISFVAGEAHLMEIGFDDEQQNKMIDFRPTLPLVFRW